MTTTELKLTDRKRAAIIDAAILEFEANGFPATSMDAIAARAQVSKRTVYNHFPGKEDLFREIKTLLCNRVMRVSDHPFDPGRPLKGQLAEIARKEVGLMISPEFLSMVKVTMMESMRTMPTLEGEALDEIKRGETGLVRWIREAAQAGKLRVEDPVMAGKQFSALIREFIFWPQIICREPLPGEERRGEIIDATVAMFLSHYGVEDEKT